MASSMKSLDISQEDLGVIRNNSISGKGLEMRGVMSKDEAVVGSSESFEADGYQDQDYYKVNLLPAFTTEELILPPYFSNETSSLIGEECSNSSYNFTCNPSEDVLPLEMQFNQGHMLSISVYSILFVFSAIGNLTVLIMLLKRRRSRQLSPTIDLMLINLAAADLIVTFLMMPLEIVWAATVYWRAGDIMCRIMAFFRIFGLFLSSFVIVCLAIDRFLAVKYPMHVLGGLKRSRYMIGFSWFLSIICSLPQVVVFHVVKHPKFPWYTQCMNYSSFPSQEYELAYFLFGMFFMYLGPFIIIVILYCGIVMELIHRHKQSSNELQNRNGDGLRRSGVGGLARAKEKALKMTVLIAAIFFVCWTPYYVMCLWYWIDEASFRKVDPRIQRALFLFACTNSTANPIVYGVFHLKSSYNRRNHESVYRGVSGGESLHSTLNTNSVRRLRPNLNGRSPAFHFHSKELRSHPHLTTHSPVSLKKTGHSKKNGNVTFSNEESYV